MTAALPGAGLTLPTTHLDDHANYIGSWLTVLKRDNRAVMTAATKAEAAAGTRGLFPQTAADLGVRWCRPSLKIDVLAAAIRNQPRFLEGRTLVVAGGRAEESPARAHYAALERHRTATRHVDHWRPVHDWTEAQVWEAIAASGIRPTRPTSRDGVACPAEPVSSGLPISGRRCA